MAWLGFGYTIQNTYERFLNKEFFVVDFLK